MSSRLSRDIPRDRRLKRLFDVVAASLLLAATSPLALLTALGIRIFLGRPILFRQIRPGLNERPFMLLKFRTMRDAVDATGRPLPDEKRLSGFGLWVRRLSLDEIPQLWNVLRGEMSLVGPRPLLMEYLPLYSAEQRRRHLVPPGITGWAQIHGRNALDWETRFQLDTWYVDHRSFRLDLKILALTFWKVVRREGVSAPGHATMPPFQGSRRAA